MESMVRIEDHDFPLLDLKIKHSEAVVMLMRGTATKSSMDRLVSMSNIVEALWQMGFGSEHEDVVIEGRDAILSIAQRATARGKFVPTGPEITAINRLVELHDAQMGAITVRDLEQAVARVEKQLPKATRLPSVPDHLKD